MTWQDWAVAVVGVLLVTYFGAKLVRLIRNGKVADGCCGCAMADKCPSARKTQMKHQSSKCNEKRAK